MMRLIDAEALASELYKHHVHDDEELEPLVYLADAEKVIANAQTVDAIPVDWIKLNIAISALVEDDEAASLLLTLVDTWHNRGWSLFDGILPAEEAKKYGIKPKK